MTTDGPLQDGTRYNLILGDTFTGNNNYQYHTLQYAFKPASIEGENHGGVLKKSENGRLEVELQGKGKHGAPAEVVTFKGNYQLCKEMECVLIFDRITGAFRLEQLNGSGKNLKAERREKDRRVVGTESLQESEVEAESVYNDGDEVAPAIKKPRTLGDGAANKNSLVKRNQPSTNHVNTTTREEVFSESSSEPTPTSTSSPDDVVEDDMFEDVEEAQQDAEQEADMADLLEKIESTAEVADLDDEGFSDNLTESTADLVDLISGSATMVPDEGAVGGGGGVRDSLTGAQKFQGISEALPNYTQTPTHTNTNGNTQQDEGSSSESESDSGSESEDEDGSSSDSGSSSQED